MKEEADGAWSLYTRFTKVDPQLAAKKKLAALHFNISRG
jgi:hypothetical protein